MKKIVLIIILLLLSFSYGKSQVRNQNVDPDNPYSLLTAEIDAHGDTIPIVNLPDIYIFPRMVFNSQKEQQNYYKLVRDVKRTLPYAILVYNTLIETYEYMETLPNDKARQQHLKRMEKDLLKDYKPELKKLSYSQGRLLIKLIDRQCHQSSYNILQAYLGTFRASFWNFFAGIFGASLKTTYDPKGKDAVIERIVLQVESGSL